LKVSEFEVERESEKFRVRIGERERAKGFLGLWLRARERIHVRTMQRVKRERALEIYGG